MDARVIARNIEDVMRKQGMTKEDLTKATGTSPITMQRWLSGYRQITVCGMYRISKALGVTMDSLMVGIEDK